MKRPTQTGGFTLIETLVAISILTLTMAAPFYAIEQSITAADVSRDELTGSNLAQEGVEYVRAIRDGNYLFVRSNPGSTQSWMFRLDGTGVSTTNCFAPNFCSVDANPAASSAIVSYPSAASILPLNITNISYLYTQQTNGGVTPTPFTRTLQLSCTAAGPCVPSAAQEVEVTVTVKWITRNIPYTTTITEYLDNWLP